MSDKDGETKLEEYESVLIVNATKAVNCDTPSNLVYDLKIQDLHTLVNTLKKEVDGLRHDNNDLINILKRVLGDLNDAKVKLTSVSTDYAKLRDKVQSTEQNLCEVKVKVDANDNELANIVDDLADLTESHLEYKMEVQGIKNDLYKRDEHSKSVQTQVADEAQKIKDSLVRVGKLVMHSH